MVSEQENLNHKRHPYGKIENSAKSLHPNVHCTVTEDHNFPQQKTEDCGFQLAPQIMGPSLGKQEVHYSKYKNKDV